MFKHSANVTGPKQFKVVRVVKTNFWECQLLIIQGSQGIENSIKVQIIESYNQHIMTNSLVCCLSLLLYLKRK